MQYFRSKFPRNIATALKNNDLSIGMAIALEKTGNHKHKQAEKHAAAVDKTRAVKELKEAAVAVAEHTVYLPSLYVYQQVRVAQNAINLTKPYVSATKVAVDRALNSLTVVVDAVFYTAAR